MSDFNPPAIFYYFVNCNLFPVRNDTRHMIKGMQPQAEKLYRQILDTLEELQLMTAEEEENAEPEEGEEEGVQGDVVEELTEEAGDRGLDEESVERVLKAVAAFEKKARDA